jgi:hypothetical protein
MGEPCLRDKSMSAGSEAEPRSFLTETSETVRPVQWLADEIVEPARQQLGM